MYGVNVCTVSQMHVGTLLIMINILYMLYL